MMHKMSKKVVIMVAGLLAMMLLFGLLTMLLWNALMPAIFGLPAIGFLQAFGLLVLARLLFGGFSSHMSKKGGHMHEKWRNMSSEERAAYLNKHRWHCHGKSGESDGKPETGKETDYV